MASREGADARLARLGAACAACFAPGGGLPEEARVRDVANAMGASKAPTAVLRTAALTA